MKPSKQKNIERKSNKQNVKIKAGTNNIESYFQPTEKHNAEIADYKEVQINYVEELKKKLQGKHFYQQLRCSLDTLLIFSLKNSRCRGSYSFCGKSS